MSQQVSKLKFVARGERINHRSLISLSAPAYNVMRLVKDGRARQERCVP
jgi:hypothetical protein